MPSFAESHSQCIRSGKLYEDPDFEAEDGNVFFSRRPPRPIVWKRPSEIVEEPHLFVDGASRLDIDQGMLGNCWFLAALSSLSQHPALLHKVIPADYGFSNEYAGIFRFYFWLYGEWTEVVIDDRLPTINNQLVFAHSKERNEFWAALVEKAYAKVHGSYEALKGGQTSEAMVDFTGGVTESYDLGSKAPNDLFQIMLKSMQRQSLMGCSINAKPNQIEAKLNNGLVMGKAYTVTGVRKVTARTRSGMMEVELVRVRNPWGNEREWTGPWGDKSSEWTLLSDEEKRDLGLTFEDDGEFWMSYRDWISNFQRVEICNLSPGEEGPMEIKTHHDRWRVGSTAGGCRNNPNTFHRNPQFRFQVVKKEGEEEDEGSSVVIALMQIDRRKLKKKRLGMLTMGFAIYKLEEEDIKQVRLDKDYFLYHASTARSSTFINSREITNRFKFLPGTYCIVPSTFDPNEQGDFVLRIFTEKENVTSNPGAVSSLEPPPRPKMTQEQSESMDARFKSIFLEVAGEDEEIDSFELQELLTTASKDEMGGKEVSLRSCRLLVNFHDHDLSGKIKFEEFKEMWCTYRHYLGAFKKYDRNRSSDLDMYELGDVLGDLGFRLSNHLLARATSLHNNKRGRLSLDDFVEIVIKIQILYKSYLRLNGRSFSFDDFTAESLY